MANLETRMRERDRDMVPLVLVRAMFGLMLLSLGIVAWAQWADVPNRGVLIEAPVVVERTLTLRGERDGIYEVLDEGGAVIARSSDPLAGFIGVIGRIVERRRLVDRIEGNPPIRVVRRENGNVAVIDDAAGQVIELIGYGADNVAAFAQFVR